MKIKDLERKFKETSKGNSINYVSFKEFYKYFKRYNYNTSLKTIVNMYKVVSL